MHNTAPTSLRGVPDGLDDVARAVLAGDHDTQPWNRRDALAERADELDDTLVEALAKDPHGRVRWHVAARINGPRHVLEALAGDDNEAVRMALLANPNVDSDLVARVFSHFELDRPGFKNRTRDDYTLSQFIHHRATPDTVFEQLPAIAVAFRRPERLAGDSDDSASITELIVAYADGDINVTVADAREHAQMILAQPV